MREPRTGEQFARKNREMQAEVLTQAAAVAYGSAAAVPLTPSVDAAHHVVDLERRRLEGTSTGRRNDPTDLRPTLKEVEASRRWGPPASLPTTPPAVQVTRQQLEAEIVALNAQLASRYLVDKDLVIKRDRLVEQLQALK